MEGTDPPPGMVVLASFTFQLGSAKLGWMDQTRVLIVDDQAPFRLTARLVVEATDGFVVVGETETGEGSVEEARRLDPDLVLMDVNLPGIDGLEATRRILADSKRAVILLLSTYEVEEYAPRADECGAAAYIPKSDFSPDSLAEAWSAATGSAA